MRWFLILRCGRRSRGRCLVSQGTMASSAFSSPNRKVSTETERLVFISRRIDPCRGICRRHATESAELRFEIAGRLEDRLFVKEGQTLRKESPRGTRFGFVAQQVTQAEADLEFAKAEYIRSEKRRPTGNAASGSVPSSRRRRPNSIIYKMRPNESGGFMKKERPPTGSGKTPFIPHKSLRPSSWKNKHSRRKWKPRPVEDDLKVAQSKIARRRSGPDPCQT